MRCTWLPYSLGSNAPNGILDGTDEEQKRKAADRFNGRRDSQFPAGSLNDVQDHDAQAERLEKERLVLADKSASILAEIRQRVNRLTLSPALHTTNALYVLLYQLHNFNLAKV